MGLVYSNFRILLDARRRGASFESVVTLGRQQIYLSALEARLLAEEFPEASIDPGDVPAAGDYCEPWLRRWLHSQRVDSVDASSYEGASIVHDLNDRLPATLAAQYSAVIDGGSLEHVFHVTTAISNAMRLARVGGWVFVATVANNHCGHGFYQFSPEWFFRVFCPANGYQLVDVLLMPHRFPGTELSLNRRLFRACDPEQHGGRVGLVNPQPVLIFSSAVRLDDREPFASPPYQSDYAQRWEGSEGGLAQPRPLERVTWGSRLGRVVAGSWRRVRHRLPASLARLVQGREQLREYSWSNHRAYSLWQPVSASQGEELRSVGS